MKSVEMLVQIEKGMGNDYSAPTVFTVFTFVSLEKFKFCYKSEDIFFHSYPKEGVPATCISFIESWFNGYS